jgi:hypothetical protein
MSIKTITTYETRDGQRFESNEEAMRHENAVAIPGALVELFLKETVSRETALNSAQAQVLAEIVLSAPNLVIELCNAYTKYAAVIQTMDRTKVREARECRIRTENGRGQLSVTRAQAEHLANNCLVYHNVGNEYFLTEQASWKIIDAHISAFDAEASDA